MADFLVDFALKLAHISWLTSASRHPNINTCTDTQHDYTAQLSLPERKSFDSDLRINFSTILNTSKDHKAGVVSAALLAKYKKMKRSTLVYRGAGVLFLGVFLIIGGSYFLFSPLSAKANIFTSLSNMYSSATDSPSQVSQNSQRIPLLQATVNPDPLTKKTPIDTSIVDGEALSNENIGFIKQSTSTEVTTSQGPDHISVYTVHAGDSLGQIAQMFDVSVNTILFANDIKKASDIAPGQILVILPISGIKYTVKKSDTIASIAKAYSADADEIADYNGLTTSSKLTVGDQIIIPNVDGPAVTTTTTTKTTGTTKTTTSTTKSGTKFVSAAGGSSIDPSGYFMRPISGGVRTQGIHGHNAVDLATTYGSPIFAAADGTVIIAKSSGYNGGYGSYVVIQHSNGMQTLYGHMSKVNVAVGSTVSKGQIIGAIGTSGNATGPHVHFEVHGGVNPF